MTYMHSAVKDTLFLPPTSEDEITSYLGSLENNSAAGEDSIKGLSVEAVAHAIEKSLPTFSTK